MTVPVRVVSKTSKRERDALQALLDAEGRDGWPNSGEKLVTVLQRYEEPWAAALARSNLAKFLTGFVADPPKTVNVRGAMKAVIWGYMHPAKRGDSLTLAHVSEQQLCTAHAEGVGCCRIAGHTGTHYSRHADTRARIFWDDSGSFEQEFV